MSNSVENNHMNLNNYYKNTYQQQNNDIIVIRQSLEKSSPIIYGPLPYS